MVPPQLTRQQKDNRILFVFAILAILGMALPAAVGIFVDKSSALQAIGSTLGGLASAFVLVGLLSFRYHRKHGLFARRRFWSWLALTAFVCSLVEAAIIVIVNASRPDLVQLTSPEGEGMAVVIPALVFGFFVATLVIFLAGLLLAFGGIGVMAALSRRITPWILRQIASSDPGQKIRPQDRAIRWLFDIPEVLDTRTLHVGPLSATGKIRWNDITGAVFWELFFGVILAIYISFNPFISDRSPSALLGIFGILISGSVLVPMIILPWFVFRRLDARIKGVTKDFTLYEGIRSRLFQSYMAVGTIIILIRLSISTIDVEVYLVWFTAFVVVLLGVSFAFTFVYFSYFEEELVEDIGTDFERNRRLKARND